MSNTLQRLAVAIIVLVSGMAAAQDQAPRRGINTSTGTMVGSLPPGADPEIEAVFDRNKGALYALYGRALRENPKLQGKILFEFTIQTTGETTGCRIVSSELHAPELEQKMCARVNLIRFKPRDAAKTATKAVDFFPAA
jgi:hypothetical protein